jgi:hypothetical protein
MTNQESKNPFVHWPIRSSSNLSGIYKQNQDNDQIYHLPTSSIPLTYLQQQKKQPVDIFPTYVVRVFLTFMIYLTKVH